MFHTQVFPGMSVDINIYDSNPTTEPDLHEYFYDGYIEASLTVTQDNLSVCTTRKIILFVRPVTHQEGIIAVQGDYTYLAIAKHASLQSVTFGAKQIETESGTKDVDIVLFGFITDEEAVQFVPVIFEHNKEAWLDSIFAHVFSDDATP